jgi:hypothetical protein
MFSQTSALLWSGGTWADILLLMLKTLANRKFVAHNFPYFPLLNRNPIVRRELPCPASSCSCYMPAVSEV